LETAKEIIMASPSTKTTTKQPRRAPASKPRAARKAASPKRRLQVARPSNTVLATLGTVIFGAGLAAIGYALMRHEQDHHVHPGSGAKRHDEGDIRHAGQESMRTGNKDQWTSVDQTSDESFPASDPPGTY
jgi:hypothetical protein